MVKPPLITINLPEGLPHSAYAAIVADTTVKGEADVRFRFGDADHWVYQNGFTLSIDGES